MEATHAGIYKDFSNMNTSTAGVIMDYFTLKVQTPLELKWQAQASLCVPPMPSRAPVPCPVRQLRGGGGVVWLFTVVHSEPGGPDAAENTYTHGH